MSQFFKNFKLLVQIKKIFQLPNYKIKIKSYLKAFNKYPKLKNYRKKEVQLLKNISFTILSLDLKY